MVLSDIIGLKWSECTMLDHNDEDTLNRYCCDVGSN